MSEIADVYHFPFSPVTQTEDLVKQYFSQLPAPLSLKNGQILDVVFGKNVYAGLATPIGQTRDERRRHTAVFGATGSGKTTLMTSMMYEDILKGKGFCVIDPHGDLATHVLTLAQKQRPADIVQINPDDWTARVGINILEVPRNLSPEEDLKHKEYIAESIISLFRKIFSDSWSGNPHRIEYMLRNTIYTAFTIKNATLFTLYDLLTDPIYRKSIVNTLTDERLQQFWKNEFGHAGSWQQVKMISPVTSRIGRFLFSPAARRILEHPTSTIDFDDILTNNKLLICDVSKGKLGEDTAHILGTLILTKLQLAGYKRARMPEEQRRDFFLYVDEFQEFATVSFVKMLAEERKYRLNIILAQQSTAHQKDTTLTNLLLANIGTLIVFKTASPIDEDMFLPQFAPYIKRGELANLPSYHFYIKLGALNPQAPFSGVTTPVEE